MHNSISKNNSERTSQLSERKNNNHQYQNPEIQNLKYYILPMTLKQLANTQEEYLTYFNNFYKLVSYQLIELVVRFHGYHSNHQTYIITDDTKQMKIQIKKHIFKMNQEQFDFVGYYRLIVKLRGRQKLEFNGVSLNIQVMSVQPILYQLQIQYHMTNIMLIQSQIQYYTLETGFKVNLKQQILGWIKKNPKFEFQQINEAFSKYNRNIIKMLFEQLQNQLIDKLIDYGAMYEYIPDYDDKEKSQKQSQRISQL